ncbi:replicative DNA helicase [Geobacter sulfurreducens]|jgi:replicative DNA helicase|uniref:Replicative DNA helicase n=1 Tax=Geobacter sulfurreducens (strain ATCC 51573 / DSM 12127 / PCA) TaxID=243231 RepID=Q74EG4_GEOSL|nr:replicative DNA helicase [Geobacter sulfurreducens]BET58844.1 replicative DNA helicase [Geobacter sp. 60473]AAR34325.1 replicative DNA helicase [Geobacter sulfurreducens PCA]ADI83839.1 replicative DNA helicase [Geobacter sulfurreducens KN400]AJY70729.1 DNA helicase [Geobacter sulfurreducens]QVW36240.1 replicative DNA helicase [Geobacter sulfurreducens]
MSAVDLRKVPPQSIEAEMSILGGVLLDNEAINRCLELIEADDFYRESHRKIFRAMIDLSNRSEPCDLITLTDMLKRKGELEEVGGGAYLATLVDYVPTAANIAYYCRIVKEKSVTRRLITAATDIVTRGYDEETTVDELLDGAQKTIFEISENKLRPAFTPVGTILKDTFKRIETLYEKKEHVTGVPTGFYDLDKMTAGFQPGDLIIIAGRPSMGKTAFSLNIAQYAAAHADPPLPVAVFSLEMSKESLVMRLLCSESRVDASRLRTGHLVDTDWHKLTHGADKLSKARLYIDDTPAIPVLEMRAKARRLKAENGLGMIVVDYLQLMRGSSQESRQQEISEISRSLKALAKELDVPVVALSQLNRSLESRTDKRPMMSDLRESGAIEQDADVIMFVYRDAVYCDDCKKRDGSCTKGHEKDAEIIIGKQRNGPIGSVNLLFNGEFTKFENMEKHHDY